MYGAGKGYIADIFARAGMCLTWSFAARLNPAFPGINPEPILPHIAATQKAVVEYKCDAGLITDGDADRIGAVDEHGNVVDAHKIFCVLLQWLLEAQGMAGRCDAGVQHDEDARPHCGEAWARSCMSMGLGSSMWCDLMLEKDVLIGGEESGGVGISKHLPERDGLLNSLLMAQVMADEKKTLGELVAALQAEYGEHQYGRVDMHINDELKKSAIARAKAGVTDIAGLKVLRTETLDGIKFFLENPACEGLPNAAETWLLCCARAARSRCCACTARAARRRACRLRCWQRRRRL